jgi:hypothetical protein
MEEGNRGDGGEDGVTAGEPVRQFVLCCIKQQGEAMKTARALFVFPLTLLLGACSTYVTQRYSISADNNMALKASGATNIGVGPFTGPAEFHNACRGAGPLAVSDNMTHTAYIRKALEDELKIAGAFAQGQPRATLSGTVTKLDFSSSRGLTGGYWTIGLSLVSSNGQRLAASEHYEFESGFSAITACKQTAEAFMPAVQNLIGKIVRSSEFKALVQ